METEKLFLPVQQMAIRSGLPEAWLRAEAAAGRLPSMRIGRKLFFNPSLVEKTLINRAAPEQAQEATHAH